MPCTTILVGKRATYDGSTIIARNEDSPNGEFCPKRMQVVLPADQPRHYRSVISHLEIDLSGLVPVRYSAVPNALTDEGVWAASGINDHDVAMSATETLTTNERVLGADPLVELRPAVGKPGDPDYQPEVPGGIGEEDIVTLVLPYVRSAREGVLRLGSLLERYGTYEMNGIAFSDLDEVWWLETVGGHHWIARRVPDDCYVTMPNQLGIDRFDLSDAERRGKSYLCSPDLRTWIADNHLDLTVRTTGEPGDVFNPREAFGSASDVDHIYNTPRSWSMQRWLNPHGSVWEGPNADYTPESDDIPWMRRPEHLITIEDVKHVLSLHYQGTEFDCYGARGTEETRNRYRPIGINRNDQLSVLQLRPYAPEGLRGVQWMAFGSNPFNALVALFAQVDEMPEYLSNTSAQVSTDSFYWTNRLIGALADSCFNGCAADIERYQQKVGALGHRMLTLGDAHEAAKANERLVRELRRQTGDLLAKVLLISSMGMRNGFARSDG